MAAVGLVVVGSVMWADKPSDFDLDWFGGTERDDLAIPIDSGAGSPVFFSEFPNQFGTLTCPFGAATMSLAPPTGEPTGDVDIFDGDAAVGAAFEYVLANTERGAPVYDATLHFVVAETRDRYAVVADRRRPGHGHGAHFTFVRTDVGLEVSGAIVCSTFMEAPVAG